MTAALASGGRELFGWGVDRHIAADTFDALNQNTRATGNWGKGRAPTMPAWPRPQVKEPTDTSKPITVKDIFNRFARR